MEFEVGDRIYTKSGRNMTVRIFDEEIFNGVIKKVYLKKNGTRGYKIKVHYYHPLTGKKTYKKIGSKKFSIYSKSLDLDKRYYRDKRLKKLLKKNGGNK